MTNLRLGLIAFATVFALGTMLAKPQAKQQDPCATQAQRYFALKDATSPQTPNAKIDWDVCRAGARVDARTQ